MKLIASTQLLHEKGKKLDTGEIISIAHFSWHPNVHLLGLGLSQSFFSSALRGLSLEVQRASHCPTGLFSAACRLTHSSPFYPTTPTHHGQPLICLPVGPQPKSSSEAHWTNAHTIYASTDRYTCLLVSCALSSLHVNLACQSYVDKM